MYECVKVPKIKDVVDFNNGIFSHMVNEDFHNLIDKYQLDWLFLTNYAERSIAPVIELSRQPDDDPFSKLTDAEASMVAELMWNYYRYKWEKLANIYDIQYDPIHNYLDEWEDTMDQSSSESETSSGSDAMAYNSTMMHNNTRTDNLSEREDRNLNNGNTREFQNDKTRTDYNSTETHSIDANDPMREDVGYGKTDTKRGEENTINSGSDVNSVWGFNSGNAVNSDRTTLGTTNRHTFGEPSQGNNPLVETLGGHDVTVKTGSNSDAKSGHDEVTHSGKIVDTGSEGGYKTVANTGTVTDAGNDSHSGTDTRTKSNSSSGTGSIDRDRSGRHFGNIGNLTSQKMIKEEIELWKWNYVQTILEDARDFLTLPIYLQCQSTNNFQKEREENALWK